MFQNLKKKINSLSNNPVRIVSNFVDENRKEETFPKSTAPNTDDTSTKTSDAEPSLLPASSLPQDASASVTASDSSVTAANRTTLPVTTESVASASLPREQIFEEISLDEISELAEGQDEELGNETDSMEEIQKDNRRLRERSGLYKSRMLQILLAYKEIQSEKEQLQVSLAQAAEKHRRQVSELKEQSQLDYQAKRDLENNYSLMLDEKDEMIQVLKMKIKLLKNGDAEDGKGTTGESKQDVINEPSLDSNITLNESQLKEKVKRLELLLTKCKDTIKTNKEKIQQLVADRDAISKLVDEKTKEFDLYKEQCKNEVMAAQEKLREQGDVVSKESTVTTLENENKMLQEKVAKLEKTGQEQLEKSREVIHSLNKQKRELEAKVKELQNEDTTSEHKLKTSEDNKDKTDEEKLKTRIQELLAENETIRKDSEEKVEKLISEHHENISSLEQKLLGEQEKKIKEIEAEHVEKLTMIMSEKEKVDETVRKIEAESHAKIEELQSNKEKELEKCRLEAEESIDEVRHQHEELVEELKKRICELDKQRQLELESRNQLNVEVAAEKFSLLGRVKELEEMLSDLQKNNEKTESDMKCMKVDFDKEREELNFRLKGYVEEIECLRKAVDVKSTDSVELQTKVYDDQALGLEVEKDSLEVRNVGELSVKGEVAEETKMKLEMENHELKKSNERLTVETARLVEEIELLKLNATNKEEISLQLVSSAEVISQLEQRINDSMERENQLNMDLETARNDNERNLELQNEEIKTLRATVEELRRSEETLKDLNERNSLFNSEEMASLVAKVNNLQAVEQSLNETVLALNVEVSSRQLTIDELKSSEQTLNDTIMSQTEEINSLKMTIDQGKSSEHMLNDTIVSQKEEINSLKMTVDQQKSSEQTLNDTVVSQREEINSLKMTMDQQKTSEQTLNETLVSQREEINSLKMTVDKQRTSEQTLNDTIMSQTEEINSLKMTVDQQKSSEQTLNDSITSQREEINSLKMTVDQQKTSEQTLNDTVASQREEVNSLKMTIDQQKSSEQTLNDTIASQREEINSLKMTLDQQMTMFYPAMDNVQKYVTAHRNRVQFHHDAISDGGAINVFVADRNKGQQHFSISAEEEQTTYLATGATTRKMEEDVHSRNDQAVSIDGDLSKIENLNKQFGHDEKTVLDEPDRRNINQLDEVRINLEQGELKEKAFDALEMASLMQLVENLGDALTSLKHVSSRYDSSVAPAEEELLQRDQIGDSTKTPGQELEQRIRYLLVDLESIRKKFEMAVGKLNVLEQEVGRKDEDEGNVIKELDQLKNVNGNLEGKKNNESGKLKDQHKMESEIESLKQERDFSKSWIAALEETGSVLREDLTILMEKLDVMTERCSSAEKTAEQYRQLVERSDNQDLNAQLRVEYERQVKENAVEILRLKMELEESRTEGKRHEDKLKLLEGKESLRSLEALTDVKVCLSEMFANDIVERKVGEDTVDAEVQSAALQRNTGELDLGKHSQSVSTGSVQTQEDEYKKEACSKTDEDAAKGMLENIPQNTADISDRDGTNSDLTIENVRDQYERELLETRTNCIHEVQNLKDEGEKSKKFYESRIADLEQTTSMLQEDVTVLMEKLNAVTSRCVKAEKSVKDYKQLVKTRESNVEMQQNVEHELKQKDEEIAELAQKLEESRLKSEHLMDRLRLLEEKELTEKHSKDLETFEKNVFAEGADIFERRLDETNEEKMYTTDSGSLLVGGVFDELRSEKTFMQQQAAGLLPDVTSDRQEAQRFLHLEQNPLDFSLLYSAQGSVLPEPIKPNAQSQDVYMSLKEHYEAEMRKLYSSFESELKIHAAENYRLKDIQKELLSEVEALKSSIEWSARNASRSDEPTELEYLRNILFKYMLGMETKTLAKVICTVIKFSPDQTKKILDREEILENFKIFSPNRR